MQWMPLQVVNKKCVSCHAQAFLDKADNLIRLKVMKKERAANRVKAIVAEGKRQRVPADGWMSIAKMCGSAIQNNRLR